MLENNLKGKTALITGSARRIGRASAKALAECGVNVVIHYRSSQAMARELQREVRKMGVKSWIVKADLNKANETGELIEEVIELTDSLEILINNASIFTKNNFSSIDYSDLEDNLKINAWSPFVLSRSFSDLVTEGKIVNFLDSKISDYQWEHLGYYLSKRVLAILTEMCALEFAPRITVNGIAPGLILPPESKGDEYLRQKAEMIPLGIPGSTDEIVKALIYLLSSNYVTGQIIYVDGGGHLS